MKNILVVVFVFFYCFCRYERLQADDIFSDTKIKLLRSNSDVSILKKDYNDFYNNKDFYLKNFRQILEEVVGVLPEFIIEKIPSYVNFEITILAKAIGKAYLPSCNDNSSNSLRGFSAYNPNTYTISLDYRLLRLIIDDAIDEKIVPVKYDCEYLDMKKFARGQIIYNLVQASEYNKKKYALAYEDLFLKRNGFDQVPMVSSKRAISVEMPNRNYEFKNINSPRILLGEKEGAISAFARNLELYLFDDNYKCRRPVNHDYFTNKLFNGDTQNKNSNCELSYAFVVREENEFYPRELDPQDILRVDYAIAGKSKGIVSGFGHSLIRIIPCNRLAQKHKNGVRDCILNLPNHLILSFAANINDLVMSYSKGVFGGYNSQLSITPYNEYVRNNYNGFELRDVEFYPLKFTDAQKETFLKRAVEMYWSYAGDYKFITNNCAVETHNLIQASVGNDEIIKDSSITPYGVAEFYNEIGLIDINKKIVAVSDKKYIGNVLVENAIDGNINENTMDDEKLEELIENYSKHIGASEHIKIFNDKTKLVNKNSNIEKFFETLRVVSIIESFIALEDHAIAVLEKKLSDEIIDNIANSRDGKSFLEDDQTQGELYKTFLVIRDSLEVNGFAINQYGIPLDSERKFDFSMRNSVIKKYNSFIERIKNEMLPDRVKEIEQLKKNKQYFLSIKRKISEKKFENLDLALKDIVKEDAASSNKSVIKKCTSAREKILQLKKLAIAKGIKDDFLGETELSVALKP